jgi:hypothetical protein
MELQHICDQTADVGCTNALSAKAYSKDLARHTANCRGARSTVLSLGRKVLLAQSIRCTGTSACRGTTKRYVATKLDLGHRRRSNEARQVSAALSAVALLNHLTVTDGPASSSSGTSAREHLLVLQLATDVAPFILQPPSAFHSGWLEISTALRSRLQTFV